MKQYLSYILLLLTVFVHAQQTLTKTVKSSAPDIQVKIIGIDNLIVKESDNDILEMKIIDADGIGFIEDFYCNDYLCTLNITAKQIIKNPLTNKINQFPMAPPSHIGAIIKIPKNKNLTIAGGTLDVQTTGYIGNLTLNIDKGNIRIKGIKGNTAINLFSGTIFANTSTSSLDILTRKGTVSINKKKVSSTFKKSRKNNYNFVVKSINANVVITSKITQ